MMRMKGNDEDKERNENETSQHTINLLSLYVMGKMHASRQRYYHFHSSKSFDRIDIEMMLKCNQHSFIQKLDFFSS